MRLSYRALRERAARLARGLAERGVGPGDRVAAIARNRRETVELFWASQWLGAVFVPLSHRASPEDVEYCLADSGALLVIGVDEPIEPLVANDDIPERCSPTSERLIILYTSGTTGRPKGVPRSHRAERAGGLSQAIQHGYRFGDRTLGVMPLYHTMGDHSLISMR